MKFGMLNLLMSSLVVLCTLISLSLGAVLPSFITVCKIGDSGCAKASHQKAISGFMSGIPKLGVEVLDPMHLDTVEFEHSGLKFKLEEGRLKGWKDAVYDTLYWDPVKRTLDLELHTAFVLSGTYTAGGKVLDLPITGHGDITLKTKDMHFKMNVTYEVLKGKDGKNHLNVKDQKVSWEETVGAQYTLTNLFGGNKQQGDEMNHYLNENWKVVTNDLFGPVIDAVNKKVYANIQNFLNNVPVEQLFLP